jgi:EAL domain-containing protein (putative c-di-GMP-specific phosphodiesterase class I)
MRFVEIAEDSGLILDLGSWVMRAARMIEIEITESLLVKDSVAVRSALERFRQLGCHIALDDFGTGYSYHAISSQSNQDRPRVRAQC